ncbi:MAG TPA: matrixin family metalloprotease, partial [Gemmataceae bacterium]
MARPTSFALEELETRLVPAIFGVPWSDARHLTISFVPDGTSVDGVGSNLFASMPGNTQAWQAEILRAVETWAQYANIDVSVVPDSGDPLGTPGATQGDPRFGDIRISAEPLSDNVLAITMPPGYLGGTRVGDIIINSANQFKIGGDNAKEDLYSVLLQEIGHALGIGNSGDPNSPMYEVYGGVRSGLTAGDIANIQSLYGARSADVFEGRNGNDTFAAARDISVPGNIYWSASPVLSAGIATASDVDYFRVKTLASNPNGLTFRLNTGMGLLAAKLTVLDANGNVLASVQSVNPQTGELTVSLSSVRPNTYYYVKVQAANPAFAVGSYQLKLVFNPDAPDLSLAGDGGATTLNDNHTDDTLGTATRLSTSDGYAANSHYTVEATIADTSDVDYYQLRSPKVGKNQQNTFTVTVRALDPTALAPMVQVYNSSRVLVPAQVLANGDGTYTVQVANADSNRDYYVCVSGDGVGDYQLTADFRSVAVNLQSLADGALSSKSATDFTGLTINRSQLMYFVLSAGDAGGTVAGVRMAIFDAAGHVVSTLFAEAGQTVSGTTYLTSGTYTVRFEVLTP